MGEFGLTAASLIAWRNRLGFKKAEAARRLGVSWTTYASYETGKTKIPLYVALACSAIAHGLPPMGEA